MIRMPCSLLSKEFQAMKNIFCVEMKMRQWQLCTCLQQLGVFSIEWFRRKRCFCVWLVNWDDVTRWGRDWDRDVRLPQFRLLLMRPQPGMRPSLPITSLKQDLLREIWIYALFTEFSVILISNVCREIWRSTCFSRELLVPTSCLLIIHGPLMALPPAIFWPS